MNCGTLGVILALLHTGRAETSDNSPAGMEEGTVRVLLVGSGGREHAIAWKLCRSPRLSALYVAPGNGGTGALAKTQNVDVGAEDIGGLVDFAVRRQIDLTVVGPEAPLVAGLVDALQAAGLQAFGPTQAAAQIEGSKVFSKRFMQEMGIPTGQAQVFGEFDAAVAYLYSLPNLPVIKASGLAAGKGVILPQSKGEAEAVLHDILVERQFGAAGDAVLIEERLAGPEVSVLAFCDGRSVRLMPAAQDHKRLLDGDQGPNTGGMGAYAPAPLATPKLLEVVEREVLLPALDGLAAQGAPYVGVLYAGLMLTEDGPKVLEFNCRLGDPETQAILPLLESDLLEVMLACVEGRLAETEIRWSGASALAVVLASGGYPGKYATGFPIQGIERAEAQGCAVFHAGTVVREGALRTAGGRVLAVAATGADLAQAALRAYAGSAEIEFDGCHYRRDIGRSAL